MAMGRGGADVVSEVYRIFADDSSDPIIPEDTIRQQVNPQVSRIVGELGLGTAWVTTAFTTATNSRDNLLPSTVEYDRLLELVYASDKVPLRKISLEEMTYLRQGSTIPTGRQILYAVTVSPVGVVEIQFSGYSDRAEAVSALVSTTPTTWPKGSATPPTIPFSQRALRALELRIAASVAAVAGPDKYVALDLSKNAPQIWNDEANELIRHEALVIIRLKRAHGPRSYSWFPVWCA